MADKKRMPTNVNGDTQAIRIFCWTAKVLLSTLATLSLLSFCPAQMRRMQPSSTVAANDEVKGLPCLYDFEVGEVPDCIRSSSNGKLFINPRYLKVLNFDSHGLASVASSDDSLKWMYINRKGTAVITGVPVFDNGPDEFHSGLVRIVRNNKYGFANRAGHIIIPPIYDGAMQFENGRTKVCRECEMKCAEPECEHHYFSGGEWTSINFRGRIVK